MDEEDLQLKFLSRKVVKGIHAVAPSSLFYQLVTCMSTRWSGREIAPVCPYCVSTFRRPLYTARKARVAEHESR